MRMLTLKEILTEIENLTDDRFTPEQDWEILEILRDTNLPDNKGGFLTILDTIQEYHETQVEASHINDHL